MRDAQAPSLRSIQHLDSAPIGIDRRRILKGVAGFATATLFPLTASRVAAQNNDQVIEPSDPNATEPAIEPDGTTTPIEDQPTPSSSQGTNLPEAAGETDASLYFADTGHNLTTPFLEFWQANGGEAVLGKPLSEGRFVEKTGTVQQAFETLSMEYNPTLEEPWTMQSLHLSSSLVNSIAAASTRTEVNGCSGSDASCQYFPDSGHTITGKLAAFWEKRGGLQMFGLPLSEPFKKGSVTTQVFERAVLDQDAKGVVSIRKVMIDVVAKSDLAIDPAFVPAPPTLGKTTLVKASDGLRLRSGPSADADVLVVLPDNAAFIAAGDAKEDWVPGYVDGYSGWVSAAFLTEPEALPELAAKDWDLSVWQGSALGETNVRAKADTASKSTKTLEFGDPVVVTDWVAGEEVFEGADVWAQLKDGTFIYARNIGRSAPVKPTPMPSDAPTWGNWIDVNLTQQLMVAYEGDKAVRTVVMTSGMPGYETPEGTFAINNRVANETMQAGTLGADGYYKLDNVLFTQYFTDIGHALHFAWWRTAETIGRPGSHGCINMLLDDSQFFWDWATIGTPVIVHK